MIDCQDHSGEALKLKDSAIREPCNGVEWASLVMDAMKELEHIFKPVAADLALYCYYKGSEFENWDVEPNFPAWYIHETNIPNNIYKIPKWKKAITSEVSQINHKTLTEWVENALQQESPQPDTDIVEVKSIEFHTVRAKILDPKPFKKRDTFVVDHFRMGKYEYPLKKINGELWVYSPLPEVFSKPSFKVRTDRYEGTFDLEIYWDWWTRTSPKDKDALEQALMNLLNKGQWKLDFIIEYLQMPKLRSLAEQLNKAHALNNTQEIGNNLAFQRLENPVSNAQDLTEVIDHAIDKLISVTGKTRIAIIQIELASETKRDNTTRVIDELGNYSDIGKDGNSYNTGNIFQDVKDNLPKIEIGNKPRISDNPNVNLIDRINIIRKDGSLFATYIKENAEWKLKM